MRDIESMKDVLARRLRARGLSQAVSAAFVCAEVNKLSGGDFVATRYRDQTVTLTVTNSILKHELQFRLPELRKALQNRLPASVLENLSFKILVRPV